MPSREPLPIVAIVGRPNVGKSRLFNRYAGHRRALVDDRPGITRDRIAEEIEVLGRTILLVDTAGLEPDPEDGLEQAVQQQAEAAVQQADAILFVVDGKAGLLPEDEAIARTLRQSDKPLAVAVNKIDRPDHSERIGEFHRMGFEPLAAISAEHGGGCFDVLEHLVGALPEPAGPVEEGGSDEIRIALVGRPNVGKSSLTNRLIGEERVVVSDQPGTTRDRIDIRLERDGRTYVLMDTAGLRRPGRRHRTVERVSALMTVRSLEVADVALLLVDASEGATDQDAHVAAEVLERGCGVVVLANKWDRVGQGDRDAKRVLEQIEHGLRFLPQVTPIPVSALTGARIRRVLPAVREAAQAGQRRIATSDLNRWLQQVVKMQEPPVDRKGGGRARAIRFYYATQTSVRPPTFILFCNEPRAVRDPYRRYLENKLREAFDFRGTPVRLRLRPRERRTQEPDGRSSGRGRQGRRP
jgi:GTP-binding protein